MGAEVRFSYHFEPKKGWMNDPNGLVWFKGYYHAFFQHNPYAAHWDKMHWGHAISTDLIHWQELEIALFPDQPYEDKGGCYSGNAIVKDGVLYLFYTSVSEALGQTQSVATSTDGVHFTKYEGNPVIAHWPEEGSPEFRDPMVLANPQGGYSMVIGTDHNGHGRVLHYRSSDLLHWDFSSVLFESEDYHATIECPSLFAIDDQYVLMYSCMDYNTHSTRFVVGDFDGEVFTPIRTCTPEVGPQFYAPQSFLAPDGRRILIGWFYDWKRQVPEGATWAGALSIPRELTLEDGVIRSVPVREAAPLLTHLSPSQPVPASLDDSLQLSGRTLTLLGTSAGDLVCPVDVEQVDILEDAEGLEVFVNHGQWVVSVLR